MGDFKNYYQKNREVILQKQKELRDNNKEKYIMYRKDRLEYYRRYNKLYRENHREYLREYFKQYYLKIKHIKDINVNYEISFD